MEWFICVCYLLAIYGISNVIVFGEGPFYILEKWRNFAYELHPNFGKLFSCMMCLPANLGLICSLVDWFLIKSISFTPFNIIFAGTNLWWIAAILDLGITSGVCWILYVLDEHLEKDDANMIEDKDKEIFND